MSTLDLAQPLVTAMHVIASVNDGLARELKLPPCTRSLGLITADSDDATYIVADKATKQVIVEVTCGHSLYVGVAHGPSSIAGEVPIILGGPNLVEVRAELDVMMAHIENEAAFRWANDTQDTAFLAHVVSRTGSYPSSTADIALGDLVTYLAASLLETMHDIDAAMKSADVWPVTHAPPPSEANYSATFLTGNQAACKAACNAFADVVLDIVCYPVQRT